MMKCNIKLHLLVVHFPSKFILFPSPREHASICCNQLWFIHARHKRIERHTVAVMIASNRIVSDLPRVKVGKIFPLTQLRSHALYSKCSLTVAGLLCALLRLPWKSHKVCICALFMKICPNSKKFKELIIDFLQTKEL